MANYSPPLRVAGSLAVTRAIGDAYLKVPELSLPPFRQHVPYITAQPQTSIWQRPVRRRGAAVRMSL